MHFVKQFFYKWSKGYTRKSIALGDRSWCEGRGTGSWNLAGRLTAGHTCLGLPAALWSSRRLETVVQHHSGYGRITTDPPSCPLQKQLQFSAPFFASHDDSRQEKRCDCGLVCLHLIDIRCRWTSILHPAPSWMLGLPQIQPVLGCLGLGQELGSPCLGAFMWCTAGISGTICFNQWWGEGSSRCWG